MQWPNHEDLRAQAVQTRPQNGVGFAKRSRRKQRVYVHTRKHIIRPQVVMESPLLAWQLVLQCLQCKQQHQHYHAIEEKGGSSQTHWEGTVHLLPFPVAQAGAPVVPTKQTKPVKQVFAHLLSAQTSQHS